VVAASRIIPTRQSAADSSDNLAEEDNFPVVEEPPKEFLSQTSWAIPSQAPLEFPSPAPLEFPLGAQAVPHTALPMIHRQNYHPELWVAYP